MQDVRSILRSCSILEFYCQVNGGGDGVVNEIEMQFNQFHSQTSRVLCCSTELRPPAFDGDLKDRSERVTELRAEVLTVAPDVVHRVLLELTAPIACPGTIQVVDRYQNDENLSVTPFSREALR